MKKIHLPLTVLAFMLITSCEHELLGDATNCGCNLVQTYSEDKHGDEDAEYYKNLDLISLRSEFQSFLDQGVDLKEIKESMTDQCPDQTGLLEKALKE